MKAKRIHETMNFQEPGEGSVYQKMGVGSEVQRQKEAYNLQEDDLYHMATLHWSAGIEVIPDELRDRIKYLYNLFDGKIEYVADVFYYRDTRRMLNYVNKFSKGRNAYDASPRGDSYQLVFTEYEFPWCLAVEPDKNQNY